AARIEEERRRGEPVSSPPLARVPRRPGQGGEYELPVSFAQGRLWFLDQLRPGTALYSMPVGLRLSGRLDARALESALAAVAARHETLRTRIVSRDGEPVQVVSPDRGLSLPWVDLGALPGSAGEPELAALARREGERPFDLSRGPLWRALGVRLGESESALLLTLHHAVGDGWSLRVLLRDLAAAYGACLSGQGQGLPALLIQYGDYAVWQRSCLVGERLESELAFWRSRLSGLPPVLE